MSALSEIGWYNQLQNDEALGGADYAEEKWFGHERTKIVGSPLPYMRPATEEELARGRWMDAWFECLVDPVKRPLSMIAGRPVRQREAA